MSANLFKSILHNLGVVCVGFVFGFVGYKLDTVFGIAHFHSVFAAIVGWLCVVVGFSIRVWATFCFYGQRMKVISLVPQAQLITYGPYRFSRNPLYLGGNVFIFLGAVLLFGSPTGLLLTVINVVIVDIMIRREEKQLERIFGEDWICYRNRVRRWF